jgi:hypothetical protein
VIIHVLNGQPTREQVAEMLEALKEYIKLAVDIRREVAAGGGIFHADCEAALLESGSKQEDVWGADWIPASRELRFEALINVRPRQGNPSTKILDEDRRQQITKIVRRLFGGS